MPSDLTPGQRSDALETIRLGIMDRLDFDTGPTQWAEGALDALLATGWRPAPQLTEKEKARLALIEAQKNGK